MREVKRVYRKDNKIKIEKKGTENENIQSAEWMDKGIFRFTFVLCLFAFYSFLMFVHVESLLRGWGGSSKKYLNILLLVQILYK